MKKNSKERLFEVMKKVNPDFKKILNEDTTLPLIQQEPQQLSPNTPPNTDFQLKTYGDLKKIINVIKLQQKGKKIAGVAFDAILSAIPGLGTAKTAFDLFKAAFSRPDDKKTNTWLDKLDIDDKTSAIVDDTVENGFLQAMANIINSQPDDKLLEPDFDMNKKMVEYLSKTYDRRTIAGIPPR